MRITDTLIVLLALWVLGALWVIWALALGGDGSDMLSQHYRTVFLLVEGLF